MIQDNKPKPQDRAAEWMCLDCVDEVHCVRDAVEGQSSCTVIHKHSILLLMDSTERSVCMVCVWISNWRESRTNSRTLDHYFPNTHSLPHPFLLMLLYDTDISTTIISTTLQLPVTASTHTSLHKHLTPIIKSVWMIRIRLDCVSVSNYSVVLRQTEGCLFTVFRSRVNWWNLMENKTHQNQELWICLILFMYPELFMLSVSSVYQYRWPDICSNHSFISSVIKLFFHLLQKNMNTLSEPHSLNLSKYEKVIVRKTDLLENSPLDSQMLRKRSDFNSLNVYINEFQSL